MLATYTCEICGKSYDYGTACDGESTGYSREVCSSFCDGRKYGRKETGWITASIEDNITKLRLEQARSDMLAAEMRAMAGRIEAANQQINDLLDTVKAMLVAAGGSEDERLLQQQCDAAGTKPSDFIAATAGRAMKLEAAARHLCSCVLSVSRKNTDEWMDYIADAVNVTCAAVGESDRFQYDGQDSIRKVK